VRHRGGLCTVAVAGLVMLAAGCAQTTAATTGLARGMGWVAQQSGTGDSLFGVCATSADGAWAVGEAGKILHFDGTSWTFVDSGVAPRQCCSIQL